MMRLRSTNLKLDDLLEVVFVEGSGAGIKAQTLFLVQWFHVWPACHFEVMTLLESVHSGKSVTSISTCLRWRYQSPFHCKAKVPQSILLHGVGFHAYLGNSFHGLKGERASQGS